MKRPVIIALPLALAGAAVPVSGPSCTADYQVVRGDTLTRIARRCGLSVAAIARASGIRNPNLIRVGQRLSLPGRRTANASRPSPGVYRIARGDTLFSLARWSGSSLPVLLAVNPGIDPHKIEIGDSVRLPAGAVRPERARLRERGRDDSPPTTVSPAPQGQESAPARPAPERVRDPEVDAM